MEFKYNYIEKNKSNLKIGIYSLCYPDSDPRYRDYQKKIFDKFGYNINQIIGFNDGDLYDGHPNYMNYISKNEDVDYFLFFDIDAIPLKKEFLTIIIDKIYNKNAILGIEQISNHLRNFGIFAGPACFCISKKTYELLGKPNYNQTSRGDVAQEITHLCKERNFDVELLKFETSKTKNWELREGIWYGNGSTYENGLIFHNFNGMNNIHIQYFIDKAEEVLCYHEKRIKDFVKEGFYINLDYKTERNSLTIGELKKYNLHNFVKRYEAVKAFDHTVECEYGSPDWQKCVNSCRQSHINIIKYAKENKLEKILIFEDDIHFSRDHGADPMNIIGNSLDSLEKINDWQIIHLGGFLIQDSCIESVDKNLFKIKTNSIGKIISGGILSAHAYIVHERAYDIILDHVNHNVPMDLLLSQELNQIYLTYPCVAVQRGLDKNDIGGKQTMNYIGYINSYLKNVRKEKNIQNLIENIKIKTLNFNNTVLNKNIINKIDMFKLSEFLLNKNDAKHFIMECGIEHYRLLSFFSSQCENNLFLDIGTSTGCSALALSSNSLNKVISFDIVDRLKLNNKINIDFIVDDILDEKYLEVIKKSSFIIIDVDPHDGIFEKTFYKILSKINWKGSLFLDDINLNNQMKEFWYEIDRRKYNLTEYGHWSGSGLVVFE